MHERLCPAHMPTTYNEQSYNLGKYMDDTLIDKYVTTQTAYNIWGCKHIKSVPNSRHPEEIRSNNLKFLIEVKASVQTQYAITYVLHSWATNWKTL